MDLDSRFTQKLSKFHNILCLIYKYINMWLELQSSESSTAYERFSDHLIIVFCSIMQAYAYLKKHMALFISKTPSFPFCLQMYANVDIICCLRLCQGVGYAWWDMIVYVEFWLNGLYTRLQYKLNRTLHFLWSRYCFLNGLQKNC